MTRLFSGHRCRDVHKLISNFNDINIPDCLPMFARKDAVFSNDFSGILLVNSAPTALRFCTGCDRAPVGGLGLASQHFRGHRMFTY